MAGYAAKVPAAVEKALATAPVTELLVNPAINPETDDPGTACVISKRANQLRVQANAAIHGARGARLNSISPGVIKTPMGQTELSGQAGEYMKMAVAASASGRYGTPQGIAAACAFLSGSDSTCIHGIDLCVDGGATSPGRWTSQ